MKRNAPFFLAAGLALGISSGAALAQPDASPTDAQAITLSESPSAPVSDAGPGAIDAAAPSTAPGAASEASENASQDAAPAQPVKDQVGGLVKALKSGEWLAAVGFGLMLLVLLLRLVLVKLFKIAWFGSKPGGYVLGYGTALLTSLGAQLSTGSWSISVITTALAAGLAATGGWSAAWDFVEWLRKRLAGDTTKAAAKILPKAEVVAGG